MRKFALIAALPMLALAVPAVAQSKPAEPATEAVVKKLEDPVFQQNMGDMVAAMMKAMMSIKIGPVIEAAKKIDPKTDMGTVDPNATIGDVAAKGDPAYAEKMGQNSQVMAKSVGVMARAMADMMPAMKAAAEKMADAADDAARKAAKDIKAAKDGARESKDSAKPAR